MNISFTLPNALSDKHVVVTVYNELGQKVAVLGNQSLEEGYQSVVWNGRDLVGRDVGSGVYYIRVLIGRQEATIRAVLVR